MAVELIVVPYALGREGTGTGAGPVALEADAVQTVHADRVTKFTVRHRDPRALTSIARLRVPWPMRALAALEVLA